MWIVRHRISLLAKMLAVLCLMQLVAYFYILDLIFMQHVA